MVEKKILIGIQIFSTLLMIIGAKHVDISVFLVYISVMLMCTIAMRIPERRY